MAYKISEAGLKLSICFVQNKHSRQNKCSLSTFPQNHRWSQTECFCDGALVRFRKTLWFGSGDHDHGWRWSNFLWKTAAFRRNRNSWKCPQISTGVIDSVWVRSAVWQPCCPGCFFFIDLCLNCCFSPTRSLTCCWLRCRHACSWCASDMSPSFIIFEFSQDSLQRY